MPSPQHRIIKPCPVIIPVYATFLPVFQLLTRSKKGFQRTLISTKCMNFFLLIEHLLYQLFFSVKRKKHRSIFCEVK